MRKILAFVLGIMMFGLVKGQISPNIQWAKCYGGANGDDAYSIQQTYDGGYITVGSTISNDGDAIGNHGFFDFLVIKTDANGIIEWKKVFGGTNKDLGYYVQQTRDSGYAVVGTTSSFNGDVVGNHGGDDIWLLKLNKAGNILWQKCYGGTANEDVYSIKVLNNNGFVIAGTSTSANGDLTLNHGGDDFWVIKLDSNGNIKWQKSLGGSDYDFATGVAVTLDNCYVLCGYTKSNNGDIIGNHGQTDFWVSKLDTSGNILWGKCFGDTLADYAYSINRTLDSGCIVIGTSYSNGALVTGNHGNNDVLVIKLNKLGVIEWQNSYGSTGYDYGFSIEQVNDGGYIIGGTSSASDGDVTNNYGNSDYWIIKIDKVGSIQWQKSVGGSGGEIAQEIHQTKDGGIIVTGFSGSSDGNIIGSKGGDDFWIVKLEPNSIVSGNIKTVLNKNISKTKISVLSNNSYSLQTDSIGFFNTLIPIAGNYTIRPSKNNDIIKANGLNATDALFVQRHILNTAKLNNAYKLIAADVNGDKAINATDVLRIKRLILGTDTTFTKGSGVNKIDRLWEFVDSAYQFPDTTNPFPFKDSISFTNLTSNKINQTFIGVKLGDVNYDWNPLVAKGVEMKPVELVYHVISTKEKSNQIDFSGTNLRNDELRIPITANNFKDLAAMQYTLHFDNSKYEFTGIENNKLNIDFSSNQAGSNGNISFLWTDKSAVEKSLEDGTELFTLVLLSTVDRQPSTDLQLAINNSITGIAAWDKDFNQHNIILSKQKTTTNNLPFTTSQWSVSPNPTNGEIKVTIVSKVNRTVVFELTDAQGKTILKQVVELQKGNNNFNLNLKKNGNITPGVYFLKAVGVEGDSVKRIMVK